MQRRELGECVLTSRATPERLIALDESLGRLAEEDSAAAELVKLHVFAGFSLDEAAEILGVSRATAYCHWTYARAWLRAELRQERDELKT